MSHDKDGGRKSKGLLIAAVSVLAVLAGAGVAGGAAYFSSDGYLGQKSFKLGEQCFARKEYEDALDYYEEARQMDPNLTAAYLGSADILMIEERYGKAALILEEGLRETNGNADAQRQLSEKAEEVRRAEAAAVSGRLQRYLDTELAPQYGSASLEPQIRRVPATVYGSEFEYETNDSWTQLSGIAGSQICDLDSDGREELLTFTLGPETLTLSVYVVENDGVAKAAECVEERVGDLTGCREEWSLVDGKEGRYLYCSQNYWSIGGDGQFQGIKLLRYDGKNKKLYKPLVFSTGWGSDIPEYRVYQYDENGAQISEEVVYDAYGSYDASHDYAYYLERMPELFAEYGIEMTALEGIKGSSSPCQELLVLDMWGEWLGEYAVEYHFNDWDSPLLAYKRFLRGEEVLYMPEDSYYGKKKAEWTLPELLSDIQSGYLANSGRSEISGVEYAFIDCGGDGVGEMQLRFVGLDIYAPDDDSDLTMVISRRNGRLEMLYACESWARSNTTIDYYGCISSGGSGGAGAWYFSLGCIDGSGNVQTVYDGEELAGWWTSYISETAYNAVFDGEDSSLSVTRYVIEGQEYCVLEADGPEEKQFAALCEQEGKHFVTQEEADQLIAWRKEALGIKEEWSEGSEVYWNQWYMY